MQPVGDPLTHVLHERSQAKSKWKRGRKESKTKNEEHTKRATKAKKSERENRIRKKQTQGQSIRKQKSLALHQVCKGGVDKH